MNIDMERLASLVSDGYIHERFGPDGLRLYNYAPKAQYEWVWTPETLACRGLVLDADGAVQSRPFGKFFNVEEHETGRIAPLPVEPFTVQEKLDGSLIVASRRGDGLVVTSRGAFDSQQAKAAASMLQGVPIPEGETWCMELIAPWNRIVVDYGDRTDLVVLARIDTATGADLGAENDLLPAVGTLDGVEDVVAIMALLDGLSANEEGYVLRFASGVRAKAKGAEYKRLHKLLTGVTPRTIWEYLASGRGIGDILDRVPDEFHRWATVTAAELQSQHDAVLAHATDRHRSVATLPTRRDQAMSIADYEHKSVVFALLDGKKPSPLIWKGLKPPPGRPFALDDASLAVGDVSEASTGE